MFQFDRLQKLCQEKGISITKLAKNLNGLTETSIRAWGKGATPRPSNLKPIADFFGVAVGYFYGEDEPKGVSPVGDVVSLRVVASVKAGYDGLMCEEYFSETEGVPVGMLRGYNPAECRLYSVRGNSMFPRILDGDKIIVHLQESVDSGDIALIVVNGDEGTVKKVNYVKGEDWLDLVPLNPEYPTKHIEGKIALEGCHVFGKVIGLIGAI